MPLDKVPQCQKRTKCHNVDGEIRMKQKCYKDVTKVLLGYNAVTWFNKDVIRVLQGCNMV